MAMTASAPMRKKSPSRMCNWGQSFPHLASHSEDGVGVCRGKRQFLTQIANRQKTFAANDSLKAQIPPIQIEELSNLSRHGVEGTWNGCGDHCRTPALDIRGGFVQYPSKVSSRLVRQIDTGLENLKVEPLSKWIVPKRPTLLTFVTFH
jgi:hypothetical protein